MRAALLSTAPDGSSDPVWLARLGGVSGVKYSTTFPGGPATFMANIDFEPDKQHRALAPGRFLYVYLGGTALVWSGITEEPQRGQPMQLSGLGIASLGKRYAALPTGTNALALADTVDAAIARGLPWSRPSALTAVTGQMDPNSGTVDDALGGLVKAGGNWIVSPAGVLTTPANPTTPALLIRAVAPPGGRSMDQFATVLSVTYLDSTTNTKKNGIVSASAAVIAKYGRIEQPIDLSNQGAISGAAAGIAAANLLAQYSARTSWTKPLVCGWGQVRTLNGVDLDPGVVRAGVMVRVLLIDPDTAGEPAGDPTFIVGQAEYDDDTETVTLTPTTAARNDLSSMLSGGGGGGSTSGSVISGQAGSAQWSANWIPLALNSPWVAKSGFTVPAYAIHPDGTVELRGVMDTGSSTPTKPDTIATLPSAVPTPAARTIRLVSCDPAHLDTARIDILTNGNIDYESNGVGNGGAFTFFSLDGITWAP